MTYFRRLGRALCFGILALICAWPALYNGQPLLFVDTPAYVRSADAGFVKLTHVRSVWSEAEGSLAPPGRSESTAVRKTGHTSMSSIADKTVLAGRSVYYGALLYMSQLGGGRFWPAVAFQSLAVLLSIVLTLRSLGRFELPGVASVVVLLAAATPMAFFVSYLMPDVFAAVTILSVANLLAFNGRQPRSVTLVWLLLLTFGLLFHTSHVVIAAVILAATVSSRLWSRTPIAWRPVTGIVCALLVAFAGEALFAFAATKLVGAPPVRPPYLMARMIADGPGYRFLKARCPAAGLAVCAFVPTSPNHTSDDLLWDINPTRSIFAAADGPTRRRIAGEQGKFVLETVAYDPAGVLKAELTDILHQAAMFSLDEFEFDPGAKGFLSVHIPEPHLQVLKGTKVWTGAMPFAFVSKLGTLVTCFSIVCLAGCFVFNWKILAANGPLLVFSVLIIMGTALNAIICGGISTPHDRYEGRVIWLLPLAAILCLQKLYFAFSMSGNSGRRKQAVSEGLGHPVGV